MLSKAERERLDQEITRILDGVWSKWEDRNRHIPASARVALRKRLEPRQRARAAEMVLTRLGMPRDAAAELMREGM